MKSGVVTLAAALLTMGSASAALAGNGMKTEEIPIYVMTPVIDCLGEAVEGELVGNQRSHEVTTPNGVYHLVNLFTYDRGTSGVLRGVITGRTWTIRGAESTSFNVKEGEVTNVKVQLFFDPVDDGPGWALQGIFKVTVNANGDQKVFIFDFGDNLQSSYKCFKK